MDCAYSNWSSYMPPMKYTILPSQTYIIEKPVWDTNKECLHLGLKDVYPKVYLGCARIIGDTCIVVFPNTDDYCLKFTIIKHEYAHCNGWIHK